MIDPVNPGPAGTFGPAGAASGASAPGDLTPLFTSGTAVISQAMQAVTSEIQGLFNNAFSAVQGAIAKAAGSISADYNAAETQLVTSGAQAQAAISAQVQSATVQSGGGGTSESGVKEGQYGWNVYSYIIAPYPARAAQGVGIPGAQMQLWCFRGSWDNGQDAVRYSLSIGGSAPPPGCILPGGPVQPPGQPTGGPPECALYRVWTDLSAPVIACQILCFGDMPTGPGQWVPYNSNGVDLATAQQAAASLCGGSPPTSGGPRYYGGCDSNGQPVSWQAGTPAPAGVTGQVGPFGDSTSALTAASCSTGGEPPGGPPPSSGTGNPCCDTTVTKLPDCIQIDLCSPEKVAQAIYMGMCKWSQDDGCFYDPIWRAIKKGLCEFVQDPTCACKIRDSDAAIYEDCDGELSTQLLPWLGQIGGLLRSGSLDDMAKGGLP